MSDEPRDDGDEPTEDPTPTEPATGDAAADGAPEDVAADDAPAEDDDGASSDDGGDGDGDGDGEDAAPVLAKAKSGPPPRPSKQNDRDAPPPRPKAKAKQARGGGRRARRRRLRRPVSMVLAIASLVGLVVLAGVLGTRAADGNEASAWTYVIVAAASIAGIALVTWALDSWSLRNRGLGALAFVVVLAAASLTAVTTSDTSPQLGLDLQGGFSVVLTAQGDPPSDNIDQAMDIIRNRIDALGVAEPEVTRQGDNVVVDLPGIEDRERAQEILGETALLEFRPVLQPGLPYDAEAAAAGEDPCAAGVAALNAPPTDTSVPTGETVPGETVPGETVPADTTATEPSATEAPADEQEGAGPTPTPSLGGVVDGESAAAPLARQDPTDTSSTTAPAETTTTAPGETTTTVAADPAADPAATPTSEPAADPAAEAGATIAVPYRPVADEEPVSCTQVGPVGFEGGSLSKAQAQLGGSTGSEWVVSVAVKGGDQAQANELINACAGGAATCPPNVLTGEAAGSMAIVLDGEVISAPTVQAPNLADDEFVITGGGQGGFPEGEAKDLALKLRYGALPVEFTRSAERQVSPTLGEDSLRAGVLAGLIGLVAVALYLLVYYRALGLVVVLGLTVWSSLMYGVICWLSATRGLTLSLSGVVGIVISIGTTVDSYVVYFERLKDEVRLGKSVRASTERSFQKAFRTILTADVASLMGAVLLWWLTVGAVRGFAFFLGLSVVLDILVAYCFSRPVVQLLARNRFFTENNVFGVARGLGRSSGQGTRSAGTATAGAAR